jgi:hypothetical protein
MKQSIKNTLKVVFLGVVGFALLVYLTLPKDKTANNENKELTIELLPKIFDVVGANPYTKKESLFSNDEEKFIIVLNHDSLVIFKDLYKKTPKTNIILVANIKDTPWLAKQIAVDDELKKMYKDSKLPLINDSNGAFINALGLKDIKQNRYFIYKVSSNGTILKIYQGEVKEGVMMLNDTNGVSDEEINKSLDEVVKVFE